MADKLIILADLGHLKAYRVTRDPLDTTPRLELFNEIELTGAHGRMIDKVSDKAGRFASAGSSESSTSENHNLLMEIDRRLVKQLAEQIDALVADESIWYLAAANGINPRIVESLSVKSRAALKKNVMADLTKIPKNELLSHF